MGCSYTIDSCYLQHLRDVKEEKLNWDKNTLFILNNLILLYLVMNFKN